MKVKIIPPRDNAPDKLRCNVELSDFIKGAPLIKMVDIAIWDGDKGPWVAFPGRQYQGNDGKKKTARFIRPVGEEWDDMNKLCNFILAEYKAWAEVNDTSDDTVDDDGGEENPFA